MKVKRATGPDGISSRLLKLCADQDCGVYLQHEVEKCHCSGKPPAWYKYQRSLTQKT